MRHLLRWTLAILIVTVAVACGKKDNNSDNRLRDRSDRGRGERLGPAVSTTDARLQIKNTKNDEYEVELRLNIDGKAVGYSGYIKKDSAWELASTSHGKITVQTFDGIGFVVAFRNVGSGNDTRFFIFGRNSDGNSYSLKVEDIRIDRSQAIEKFIAIVDKIKSEESKSTANAIAVIIQYFRTKSGKTFENFVDYYNDKISGNDDGSGDGTGDDDSGNDGCEGEECVKKDTKCDGEDCTTRVSTDQAGKVIIVTDDGATIQGLTTTYDTQGYVYNSDTGSWVQNGGNDGTVGQTVVIQDVSGGSVQSTGEYVYNMNPDGGKVVASGGEITVDAVVTATITLAHPEAKDVVAHINADAAVVVEYGSGISYYQPNVRIPEYENSYYHKPEDCLASTKWRTFGGNCENNECSQRYQQCCDPTSASTPKPQYCQIIVPGSGQVITNMQTTRVLQVPGAVVNDAADGGETANFEGVLGVKCPSKMAHLTYKGGERTVRKLGFCLDPNDGQAKEVVKHKLYHKNSFIGTSQYYDDAVVVFDISYAPKTSLAQNVRSMKLITKGIDYEYTNGIEDRYANINTVRFVAEFDNEDDDEEKVSLQCEVKKFEDYDSCDNWKGKVKGDAGDSSESDVTYDHLERDGR